MVGRALSAVFRNPELRRVELAFVTFNAAEWGTWIAMLVFAYEQGGTTTAGLVALAQLIPAGLCAPFAAVLADRRGPSWMLTVSYVAQAVTMGATAAALFADAQPLLVYALAAAAATSFTLTRPAQAALVPGLARTPEELTAANVVSSWIESLGIFLAPAAAGVLLGVSGPASVFAVMAVTAAAGGLLTIGLPGPAGAPAAGPVEETVAGFRLLARDRPSALLVGLLGAQYIAIGALDVLYVVLALGVLGLGEARRGVPERGVRPGRRARDRRDGCARGALAAGPAADRRARRLDADHVDARGLGDDGRRVRPARRGRRGAQPARRLRAHAPPADRSDRAPLARLRRARGADDGRARDRVDPRADPRRDRRHAGRADRRRRSSCR